MCESHLRTEGGFQLLRSDQLWDSSLWVGFACLLVMGIYARQLCPDGNNTQIIKALYSANCLF